jgi:hypothetical protein
VQYGVTNRGHPEGAGEGSSCSQNGSHRED